jgi:hypothetical protein
VVLAVPIVAVGLAAAAFWAPAGARAATPTSVTATITSSRIVFAPSYVPTGKVVITVVNRTKARRDFGVGARRTGAIGAGRTGRLTVTVSGSGARQFSSVAAAGSRQNTGGSHRLTATLHLFEPCSDAVATTVNVQIDQSAGGLTLSPTTVPCGTVTFDVTDVDTPNARLLVSADAPPRSGLTAQLNPGGTATLTINFPATALAHFSAVQVGGDGVVTVVGEGSLTVG